MKQGIKRMKRSMKLFMMIQVFLMLAYSIYANSIYANELYEQIIVVDIADSIEASENADSSESSESSDNVAISQESGTIEEIIVNTGDVFSGFSHSFSESFSGSFSESESFSGEVQFIIVQTGEMQTGKVETGEIQVGEIQAGEIYKQEMNTGKVATGLQKILISNGGQSDSSKISLNSFNTGIVATGVTTTGMFITGQIVQTGIKQITSGGASVTFFENTQLISQELGLIDLNEFLAPKELPLEQIQAIDQSLAATQVKEIYKIGGDQRIDLYSGDQKTQAFITIPTQQSYFNNTVAIYSSQDKQSWEYHDTVQVDDDQNVVFSTNHFTYFSLGSTIGTMVLNGDAGLTTGYNVTIQSAISGAVQMKFSHSFSGLSAAVREPYAPTKLWSLTGDNGTKRIYGLYRDASGVTGYVFDDILLNVGSQFSVVSLTGIVAWFDASDTGSLIINANNRISQWIDKSGNGNDMTQASISNQPWFQATGFGGAPTVFFDGSTWITTTTSFPKPYTIVSVSAPDPSDTTGCLICSADPYWMLGYWFQFEDVMYAPFGWVRYPGGVLTSVGRIYSALGYGATTDLYKNGLLLATDVTNRGPINRLQLGRLANTTTWTKRGTVSEIIIFDRQLSSGELDQVHCYFADKWGVQIAITCDTSVPLLLSNPSLIPTPSANPMVSFSFDSTKTGSIVLSGACAGSLINTTIGVGSNTITFGPLSDATYNNCSIIATDNVNQQSNALPLPPFVINSTLTGQSILPTNFPGLQLWLDASDLSSIITNANNRVTERRDKSGLTNHVFATATSRQPLLLQSAQNSLNTIHFQGDDSLNTTATTLLGNNSDYTKFVVMALDNSATTNCTFGNFGGHTLYYGNTDRPRMYNQGQVLQSSIGIGTNQYAIVVMTYDSSVANTIHINGSNGGSNTTVRNYNDNGVMYVGSWGNNCPLQGKIAEIGVYNQGLSTAQRQDLECYLANKWGINVGLSCSNLSTPIVSNPSTIPSPTTGNSVAFSFTSNSAGSIQLYGLCAGLLQSPTNAQAISGSNTIQIGPVQNGTYADCGVSVTNPATIVSNVLSLPSFDVVGVSGSAPVVGSGVPGSYLMPTTSATASFYTDTAGNIELYGDCAASSFSPVLATTGSNTIAFAFLQTGNYTTCRVSVTNSLGQESNKAPISPFEITDTSILHLGAPQAIYLPMMQSLAVAQTSVYNVPHNFSVCDDVGLDAGWYSTLQLSTLSGNYASISAANISLLATGVTVLSGQSNTNVYVDPSVASWKSLEVPRLFLKRDTGLNYAKKGCYGTMPSLKVDLPLFPIVDQYAAVLTYTIYE